MVTVFENKDFGKVRTVDIDNKILEVDIDDESRLLCIIEAIEDAGFEVK